MNRGDSSFSSLPSLMPFNAQKKPTGSQARVQNPLEIGAAVALDEQNTRDMAKRTGASWLLLVVSVAVSFTM
jgi:hypothetical protein